MPTFHFIPSYAPDYIAEYYQKIVNLVQHYENCKITILETPVYSIYNRNKHRRHKTPEEFKNQDSLLAEQVVKLNFKVKEINDNINSHSPKFSIDLQIRTKYKKGNHRTGTSKHSITSTYMPTEFTQMTY